MGRACLGEECWCGACRAQARGTSYEDWLDQHLLDMHDRIRRYAYTFTAVGGEGTAVPWVYSVGLMDTFGHPELTVVGMPPLEGFAALNAWAALIRAGVHPKRAPALDDRGGIRAKFVEVHTRHCRPACDRFADWHRYHAFLGCDTLPLQVLQLLLPDGHGRFPGDEGYDPALDRSQRLLDR